MLLQLALDRPESLSVVQVVADLVDIIEIGTPFLKRFGLSAISTVRELAPGVPILADAAKTYPIPMPMFKLGESVPLLISPTRAPLFKSE